MLPLNSRPGFLQVHAYRSRVVLATTLALAAACRANPDRQVMDTAAMRMAATPSADTATWCARVPRAQNETFERVPVASDWFKVYRVAPGIVAITEPDQFQEAISYLIIGSTRALLFDTGIGLVPMRPLINQLTSLPVTVINSHTHFDHVGANSEFAAVLALDTPYTRRNQRGFTHADLASEVAPTSFCHGAPAGADTAAFHTRAWKPTGVIRDGDRLDLGGRTIEVIHVPGHTPDALALLDRANGLLWTGDSYYDAPVWLYMPETNLDAYEQSIARLAALAPTLTRLLPAHNTVSASPARLVAMQKAIRQVRSGGVSGIDAGGNQVEFRFDGFSILTSRELLAGRNAAAGSGPGPTSRP